MVWGLSGDTGDTTPCRMTRVTSHSHGVTLHGVVSPEFGRDRFPDPGPFCTNLVIFKEECLVNSISQCILIPARSKCHGDGLGVGGWDRMVRS